MDPIEAEVAAVPKEAREPHLKDKQLDPLKSQDFDSLHRILPHSHLHQFYKSVEDYVNVLALYFRAGLSKGEACVWLVSESMSMERVQAMASKMIPDFMLHICTGQLSFRSANKWYLSNGRFSESQTIENVRQVMQQYLARGYQRIRACGDASVIPMKDRKAFGLYEKKMHAHIHEWPLIVVCAYPIFGVNLSEMRGILDHHDHMMVGYHLF